MLKGNNRNNFVFALGFIVILLAASTLLGPEVLFAQTIRYSFLPSSASSPLTLSTTRVTDVAFVTHSHKGNTHSDPPPSASTQAASSSSSASSPSTNASLIQITAGKVQEIRFSISNNNIATTPSPLNLPTSITNLEVSLASQNNSVRILGPSNWNLPTISPGSEQRLTTPVFASTSLIGSPVFFTVTVQYIQNGHQVKTASFNLGAIVVGNIQLSVNNLGIRYIGSTPNLSGNILNEGNTPAQFASVEMLNQGQGQAPFPSSLDKNLTSILVPGSSQYLGNIATNSPVPFNIPLEIVQVPGGKTQKQQQQNASIVNNSNSRGTNPPPLLSETTLGQSTGRNFSGTNNNISPGTYPVSIKITYVDDLKNTREAIVNSTINVFGAQSLSTQQGGSATDPQLTSSNGFVDAYWVSNTARVANGNGTISSSSLQATPVPQQQEASPGDGQSIFAVELSNTEFSTINGITGYLTLPPGFSAASAGIGTVNGNINPVSAQHVATASYTNLVSAGQTYTLYFKVNIGKTATLGSHLSSLRVYYFKVPELEPGQYRSQSFSVPFILPGKVILDTIPTTTSLNPGVSNVARIEVKNQGSAAAHSVIVSVTGISGNSISGSNVGSSTAAGNSVNSTTGPGAQITTITPQSSIPTVNLGARTFNIGTIPVAGRAEIDTIMYPSYSAGGTLQNLNLQISYANAVGSTVTSSYSVGFLVLPTPPQAGITVAPFAGQTLTNNNTSSTTTPNANPSNNNTTATTSGITASPSNSTSASSSLPSNNTNSSSPLSTSSSSSPHSNTSGNNNTNSNRNSSGGVTVSPSYASSNMMPKTTTDNNRINKIMPIVHIVYKIAKGNNIGTTTSANAANNAISHGSATTTKSAPSNTNNNQLNSSSLFLVAGNTEDMKFNVANNNDVPITNAVVSIASQTNGLKIVGDTLWSLASLGSHSTHQFSTKIFASASLIAQPVSFLVTMQYISHGQSQVGSFILGGTVIGSIVVTASGISINYIAGVPNLVGNLLNQGNTIGLYTTVQLINQPFSTANQSSTTNQQQQPHHQHQSGGRPAAGSGQLSSSSAASTTPAQSSAPTSLPPPQYLGDLQPDSPLPFSIPLTANLNSTAPGIYPVKLEVTYSDDLKNSHTTVLNNTVQLAAQQQKARNGQGGGIFGFLTGGGSHGRGGGAGGGSEFLGIPVLLWIAIIAAIAIAFLLIRRRRRSRAAFTTTATGQEEGDSEDIESLIDGSHKPSDKKKEGGGTKPPL
jgi:predicted lipid-binding transport protein (Tim44 family)